jgi:predicted DNA-binding transcriptional regulator
MIVHHYAKSSATNPRQGGQRMLGTQAFHGWVESALYLSKPDKYITQVEREVRNFEPQEDFTVEYVGGEDRYEVEVSVERKRPKRKAPDAFEKLCLKNSGASVRAIAQHLGISRMTVRRRVEKSTHVMLSKRKNKQTGRPMSVVVKRTRG